MSTKAIRAVSVRCDEPGCDARFIATGTDLAVAARVQSVAAGWVQTRIDLCPHHRKSPPADVSDELWRAVLGAYTSQGIGVWLRAWWEADESERARMAEHARNAGGS